MIRKRISFFEILVKQNFTTMLLLFLLELLIVLSSIGIPYFLGDLIKSMELGTIDMIRITKNLLLVIGMYLLWDIMNYINYVRFSKVNKSIVNDTRMKCYDSVFMSNMSNILKRSEGSILTKVIKDTQRLENTFSSSFNLMVSAIHIVIIFLIMFFISWSIAIVILLLFIVVASIQRMFSKMLKTGFANYKESEERLLIDLKNYLQSFLTIKLFSLESNAVEFLQNNNQKTYDNYIKLIKRNSFLKNLNFFIISLFRIIPIFFGGYLYTIGHIKIGSIFVLYSYAIQLSTQIRIFVETDIMLKDVSTSIDRLNDFFDDFANDYNGNIDVESVEEIRFNNVCFSNNEKLIFESLSFEFERGDIVAVRGRNGTGKTTLMNIISGLYKPDGVTYNSIESKLINERTFLKNVAYNNQVVSLIQGTIIDNISCFGTVTEEEVINVCKTLGIHKKILQLENGYNTIVNERNNNLSGGEKQMISLARTLLKNSSILILDEIESALDIKSEYIVLNNLKNYFSGKIVFIISHREGIYKLCNKEINLNKKIIGEEKSLTVDVL